jgi:hypothetical protein
MARQAHWWGEACAVIGAAAGIPNLVVSLLSASRAGNWLRCNSANPLCQWFRSSTLEFWRAMAAIGVRWVALIRVGARCARLCPAKNGSLRGQLEFVFASSAAVPSSSTRPRQDSSLRPPPEPNQSINRQPNPLRGFGSLAALGAGCFCL